MKPALEQIKTDESVWPEGATHYTTSNDAMRPWLNENNNSFFRGDEWIEYPSLIEIKDHLIDAIPRPTKAFAPEVGEWFTAANGDDHMLIGKTSYGHFVTESKETVLNVFRSLDGAKPIKSERDLFIETAIDCHSSVGHSEERMLNAMYDSGKFKLVEPTK